MDAEALRRAARRHGTPTYVVELAALDAAAADLAAAFPDPWLRAYSLKANDVPAVVARLGAAGLAANAVSSGEWAVARRAGIPNARITLEGIGKSRADLRAAVAAAAAGEPLRWVAVESREELDELAGLAARAGLGTGGRRALEVLLRLNPEVRPETHGGLAVGRRASKFGMTGTELTAALERLPAGPGAPIVARGIHLHVGSQLGAVDAWRAAVRRGLALLALLGAARPGLDTLDAGGGFPIGEPGAVPPPARFAAELRAALAELPDGRRPARIAVEPGRFLVARSTTLVAAVLHVRADRDEAGPGGAAPGDARAAAAPEASGVGRVVVLDAGMTELIRPALYGARHGVSALTSLGRPIATEPTQDGRSGPASGPARVDGPVCESTDTLGLHDLPPLRRGDLVAIADAGAYGASMASAYNGRPLAPHVLLHPDGRLELGRRRGAPPLPRPGGGRGRSSGTLAGR